MEKASTTEEVATTKKASTSVVPAAHAPRLRPSRAFRTLLLLPVLFIVADDDHVAVHRESARRVSRLGSAVARERGVGVVDETSRRRASSILRSSSHPRLVSARVRSSVRQPRNTESTRVPLATPRVPLARTPRFLGAFRRVRVARRRGFFVWRARLSDDFPRADGFDFRGGAAPARVAAEPGFVRSHVRVHVGTTNVVRSVAPVAQDVPPAVHAVEAVERAPSVRETDVSSECVGFWRQPPLLVQLEAPDVSRGLVDGLGVDDVLVPVHV